MNANRLLAPIAATLVAAGIVAAATIGGDVAAKDQPAQKGDRFAIVSETLCAGQSWPNLSEDCLAWTDGSAHTAVRFVTMASHDAERGETVLTRKAVGDEAL